VLAFAGCGHLHTTNRIQLALFDMQNRTFGPYMALHLQVADICVEALVEDLASNKVVEVIAEANAPSVSYASLFSTVTYGSTI
jgi:hypothetical protein